MRRSIYVVLMVLALLLIASMFAPTPVLRAVGTGTGSPPSCAGLATAYAACVTQNPDPSRCDHLLYEALDQGCTLGTP